MDHADRGAVLRRPQPVLAHIGESRAFRPRSGRLRQITEEHMMSNLVAGAFYGTRMADGHYLLRPGGLSMVVDDRPH
jgi:hypothetical protein